ncbi:MAG: hypothetical protein IKE33_02770 [Erysipelotrichaceae bacterium]|nr:hypothetical protein [Erysipelotrichaceae bacterium]
MGNGYALKCNNCGFEIDVMLGRGFLYPSVCQDLIEKAKNGEFGEEYRRIVVSNPHSVIDGNKELYACKKCGDLKVEENLSIYTPKEVTSKVKKGEETNLSITRWISEGRNKFKCIRRYVHKCSECNTVMKKADLDRDSVSCPKCKGDLEIDSWIMWD